MRLPLSSAKENNHEKVKISATNEKTVVPG